MNYTNQNFDHGYQEDSGSIISDNQEIYETFDLDEELDKNIELEITNESYEENPEHLGTDDKSEGTHNIKSKNENYKWTKFEEERVLYVYFKDLLTEPLLTGDQEKELAAQIKECQSKAQEIEKQLKSTPKTKPKQSIKLMAFKNSYTNNAEELKSRFITANLRLVISLAKRHLGKGLPLTDLVQEGNLGLIRAVEKFDHTKGFKFSTYGAWWIHQALTRAIAEKTRTIKVPVYVLEQSSKVFQAKYMLLEELERKPYPQEIADRTKLSLDIVEAVLGGSDKVVSLDNPIREDKSKSYIDFLPDANPHGQDYNVDNKNMKSLLSELLQSLSEKEQEIVRMRYGFESKTVYTLDEIGSKFGVTRERIRQIEKSALEKIALSSKGQKLKGFL